MQLSCIRLCLMALTTMNATSWAIRYHISMDIKVVMLKLTQSRTFESDMRIYWIYDIGYI